MSTEIIEFNHEGLPHNLSQSDILNCMERGKIDEMIRDTSQTFRGLARFDGTDNLEGLSIHGEDEVSKIELAPEDCSDVLKN